MKPKVLLAFLLIGTLAGCSGSNVDEEGPPVPDLRSYLDENPTLRDSIRLENTALTTYFWGGPVDETLYAHWSEEDKAALDSAFSRAWINLYVQRTPGDLGIEEFTMPLNCPFCEQQLISAPTGSDWTTVIESLSKRVYIAYVAQSLALELGNGVNWKVLSRSSDEFYFYFNSRSMMYRVTGNSTDFFFGESGAGNNLGDYNGRGTPATPIYAYWWLFNNNLLASTHEETIANILQWFRENAVHYYGAPNPQNFNDHYGYPSQPSAFYVITGTTLVGESSPRHWTAGCHGTTGFIKQILRAINIPVEVRYNCGHAQLYFPSIDRYLIHGDDPYSQPVKDQAAKPIIDILVESSDYETLMSGTPHNTPANTGVCGPVNEAIGYGVDNF